MECAQRMRARNEDPQMSYAPIVLAARTAKQERCTNPMDEVVEDGRVVRLECPKCGWRIEIPEPKKRKT